MTAFMTYKEECESLREQLSVAASEILALRKANKECVEYFAESQKDLAEKDAEIERLDREVDELTRFHEEDMRQIQRLQMALAYTEALELGTAERLAAANAEIARLKANSVKRTHELLDGIIAQAACQAREQQLRDVIQLWLDDGIAVSLCTEQSTRLLSTPQNTSALEAMIQKAGEVMRERCAVEAYEWAMAYVVEDTAPVGNADAIRALPNVTLEDLRK